MVKRYLSKCLLVVTLIIALCWHSINVQAAVDLSNLFVNITEASLAVEAGDQAKASEWVAQVKQEFEALAQTDTAAGREVKAALETLPTPLTEVSLVNVSSKLLAYEKEQNPVDIVAGRQKLEKRLMPTLANIQTAIDQQDLTAIRTAYKQFDTAWTANEKVIRDTNTAYYGKIETATALLRSAIETDPVEYSAIQANYTTLKTALDDYLADKAIEAINTDATLADGIKLLEDSYAAFQAGDTATGSATMRQFVELWPTIEGDISTRNPELYNRVESEAPVIMVKGQEATYQASLRQLITDLQAINPSANYMALDAMSIILREGLEALLIILALVSSLKSMKRQKALRWVYAGAGTGLVASAGLAVILATVIPLVFAGTARELIEAYTGFFAVVMLGIVGIWLHQRSSLAAWQRYVQQQMASFEATGSLWVLFGVSFLAVFREGAETILFFVGILPKISWSELALGVGAAIVILVVLWLVFTRLTHLVMAHRLFAILSWLIYLLAIKMLGVSLHTLQVTNYMGIHPIPGLPTIDLIGFYPNWEVIIGQIVLIVALVGLHYWAKARSNHDA